MVSENVLLPWRGEVVAREVEMQGCVTMAVRSEDRSLEWEPGQFYMVSDPGRGEVPLSVSGGNRERSLVRFTIMGVGAITRGLCRLQPGDVVGLRGPYGRGWPLSEANGRDVLVVAGGLGIAPLRPVIQELVRRRTSLRSVSVMVGARAPGLIAFREELETWRTSGDLTVEMIVDHADRGWKGRVGVVTQLLKAIHISASGAIAFVCGPEVMMRFTAAALIDRGVAPDQLYVSLERDMKCGVGFCGQCQLGPYFICKDGPVLAYSRVQKLLAIREV